MVAHIVYCIGSVFGRADNRTADPASLRFSQNRHKFTANFAQGYNDSCYMHGGCHACILFSPVGAPGIRLCPEQPETFVAKSRNSDGIHLHGTACSHCPPDLAPRQGSIKITLAAFAGYRGRVAYDLYHGKDLHAAHCSCVEYPPYPDQIFHQWFHYRYRIPANNAWSNSDQTSIF